MLDLSELSGLAENTPVTEIDSELTRKAGVRLYLKREDLIHNYISGNKWRKLKYNLLKAKEENKDTLLTFGGAYSNHIAAVAEAGAIFNFKTIGIIRGEASVPLNDTLQNASTKGMQLYYASRSEYRDKAGFLANFSYEERSTYVIPEGGTNLLALRGCAEIIDPAHFKLAVDYYCVACGTGGTAAGIISGLEVSSQLIAYPVLKGGFMEKVIRELLDSAGIAKKNWQINNDYHFGGYAKFTPILIEFINNFKKEYNIQLDPIYTGKLLYGVLDSIAKGFFPRGSTIMAIHTGGQQGITGFNKRFGNIIR